MAKPRSPGFRIFAWAGALLLCLQTAFAALAFAEPRFAGRFDRVDLEHWGGPRVPIHIYRPDSAGPDAPVVIVMHGVERDARRYLQQWAGLADARGFVVAAPEFSRRNFPDQRAYNQGGVFDWRNRQRPRAQWAFSAIEPAFDAVVARENLSATSYVIYGHSAGAQFVHRFMLLGAGPRASRAISANAGWYTLADARVAWPYGLGGVQGVDVRKALQARLIVLLGDRDTDRQDPNLEDTPGARAQGATRLARGQYFYTRGVEGAHDAGASLGWACVLARGVSHDNARAAPFASQLLWDASLTPGAPCHYVQRDH